MKNNLFFGMNIHNEGFEAYPRTRETECCYWCKNLGVDIIRFNYNPYDDDSFDYAIKTAKLYKDNGFKFMLCMDYHWWIEKTEEEYFEFFKTISSRMKGYVDYYQIFNEIDIHCMFTDDGSLYNPGDGLVIENYNPDRVKHAITAVKSAIDGIKAGDKDANTCINFSWWHTKMLELFDENGIEWDTIGIDWYSEMEDVSSVVHLLAWLQRRFPKKDVLFCECNWRTFINQHDIVTENGDLAINMGYSKLERDARQSVWISDFMDLMMNNHFPNLKGIIFYELLDEIAYGEDHGEAMYGFMRCDRDGGNKVPKIAFQVLKNKIKEAKNKN